MRHRISAISLAICLCCLFAQRASGQSRYLVGPTDVLAISVWTHPELSGKFTIEADGTLSFPLAGRLQVAGRSVLEVEEEIRGRLDERFVKNPVVTVTVEEYQSQRVSVLGEVQKPGSYPLTGATTLLEVLAQAGSTNQYAGGQALILHKRARTSSGSQPPGESKAADADVTRIDLERLQRGELELNVALHAGDTILIPRGETIFVFGFVNKPGEYVLRKSGTTVMQALALAGGASEQGSTRRLRISRQSNGHAEESKASLNDVVRPGDTIIVGQRVF